MNNLERIKITSLCVANAAGINASCQLPSLLIRGIEQGNPYNITGAVVGFLALAAIGVMDIVTVKEFINNLSK